MQVVCKMQCRVAPEVLTDQVQKIGLGAVYEADPERRAPENAVFGNATPWGEIVMGVGPVAAKEFFKVGKSYYVTFTEAPD